MDIEALLQTHGDDAPSGPDLEYDNDFMELEIAARPSETRQVGDTTVEGEEPDHKDVYGKALAVLARTHDIRAAVIAMNSGLRMNGLQALADGTTLIRGYLEQYWESCHPQLDEDDGDPAARVNAVTNMTEPRSALIRSLRLAPLTDSRSFGRISLRDIQISEGEIPKPDDMDAPPDSGAISAAFQDTDAETLSAYHTAAATAFDNIKAIDAVFDDQVPGQGPDMDHLKKIMHRIVSRLGAATGAGEPAEETAGEEDAMAETGAPVAAAPAAIAAPGVISSRADVTNAIERIITYYENYEPSSPVPLLLQRAKRLVNADFMTIMRDMAPAGVENVSVISGDEDG